MAYYFAVETEKNSYVAKNIRNSKYFGSQYYKNVPYECTLGEIDDFTSEFESEDKLKEQLYKEEIIKESDLDKNIAIIFSQEITRRKVGGNILYKDSKVMLDNPSEVIKYIGKVAKEKDSTFFRELSEKLPDGTINKSLVCKVASLIELSITDESNKELEKK